MTDDLVKRLRDSFIYDQQHYAPDPLVAEAADRIEALQAEVNRLEVQLSLDTEPSPYCPICGSCGEEGCCGSKRCMYPDTGSEALQAENAKLRKTLRQIAYGGAGVPYGYFGEPLRAYQLQHLAIAALQETGQ